MNSVGVQYQKLQQLCQNENSNPRICTFGITWLLAFVPYLVFQKARGITYHFENWMFAKADFWGGNKQWTNVEADSVE